MELPTSEITSSSVVETLVPISSEPIQITSFVAGTVYFTDYRFNVIDGEDHTKQTLCTTYAYVI